MIGSFCWKCRGVMILKSGAKFEEKPICCFKIDKDFVNLIQALKSLKKLHFDWSLLCKVYNIWPKKVQRSYISRHWRVMQNLKKNWLVVWKMTWGIWQIFTRARKVLKIGLSLDPFIQSRKWMSLKIKRELCVTTMKNDTKL